MISSSRRLATDISSLISDKFSAVMFQSNSIFTLTNVTMRNSYCSSSSCLGGVLAIFNSYGSIEFSEFTNNNCQSSGGAIGLVNLNGNTTI